VETIQRLDDRYRAQFLDWIRPVSQEFFRGKTVLEGGCGKGRHTALAAEFGASDVVAIDLSEAAEVAYANTGQHPAVHIVQADLNHPPVRQAFDYAFSVGVLHHLPEPERGFQALVSRIKPGGHISAWVYGREGNGWIVHLVSPVRENVTARLPHQLLRPVANVATVPLFLAARLLYSPTAGTAIGRRLPYGDYIRYIAPLPFREHRTIVFDHLVAPVAFYLRRDEFAAWFDRAGLDDIRIEHHNANSWRGFARVPGSG
jgi:SAM-dependent methyltransferase